MNNTRTDRNWGAMQTLALLGVSLAANAEATTITVTSTASDRGTFTELQCLPPGSDVDAGPGPLLDNACTRRELRGVQLVGNDELDQLEEILHADLTKYVRLA